MKKEKAQVPDEIWVLFDRDNGGGMTGEHGGGRRYLWWFASKAEAMEHRRAQHKNRNHARLSMPVRFTKEQK